MPAPSLAPTDSEGQLRGAFSATACAAPLCQAARDLHVRPVRPLEVIPTESAMAMALAEAQAAAEFAAAAPALPLPLPQQQQPPLPMPMPPAHWLAEYAGLDDTRPRPRPLTPETLQQALRAAALSMCLPENPRPPSARRGAGEGGPGAGPGRGGDRHERSADTAERLLGPLELASLHPRPGTPAALPGDGLATAAAALGQRCASARHGPRSPRPAPLGPPGVGGLCPGPARPRLRNGHSPAHTHAAGALVPAAAPATTVSPGAHKRQRPYSVPAHYRVRSSWGVLRAHARRSERRPRRGSARHLDWLTSLVRSVWRGVDRRMHPRAKLRAAMAQLARLAEWYVAALPEALTYVSPAPPEPSFPELPQLPRALFAARRRPLSHSQRAPPAAPPASPPRAGAAAAAAAAASGPPPLGALAEQSGPSSHRRQRRSARWRGGGGGGGGGGSPRNALLGPRFFLIQRHLVAMQERRERLRQRALAKQHQQPRRAVSALPLLDARALLELEDEQADLAPVVQELRLPPEGDPVPCPAACDPDALPPDGDGAAPVPASAAGQGTDSLRRSSSCAGTSPLAPLSAASLAPTASRRSPSAPRLKLRRRQRPHSPSRPAGGYSPARPGAARGADPQSSDDARGPHTRTRTRTQSHRGRRAAGAVAVAEAEAKAGELLTAVRMRAEDSDVADVPRSNAVETALKVLGAVLVLSPANSGTGNASEAAGAAAHLLIDSTHRSKFLSGMQLKQRGREAYSQKFDHAAADEISIKFVSTTIGSSATLSSENTDSNSTDIPVVSITRNSLKSDFFNKSTLEVASEQPDFMRSDICGFADSCNDLRSVVASNRRTEKSTFSYRNSMQYNDGYLNAKSNFSKEAAGAYYTDKNLRKSDQNVSREVAMIYASMEKRHSSKISESKKQQDYDQLTSLAEMNEKDSKTCSLKHDHALQQFLPLDEKPVTRTATRNDEFLYLSPSENESPNRITNALDDQPTGICQENYMPATEASRICARLQGNFSRPSHSKLSGTDGNSPYSSQILSHLASADSSATPVDSQPVALAHAFSSSRKSSAGHLSSATSDTSCGVRSRKFGDSCARRQRLSFTIPDIPPYRGSSRSKDINRSTGDENRVKQRRSQREVSLPCENDKRVASKPTFSATVLTPWRELENLRQVSSSTVISPPTGFTSPATGRTRPSTPTRSLHGMGSIENIKKQPTSGNIVVESNVLASTAYCLHDPLPNDTPLTQRTCECFGVESRPTDCFPSLISSPDSSLRSSHSSPYISASQSPEHSLPPSCTSSAFKKLSGPSLDLSTTVPAESCQLLQQLDNDASSQSNEALHRTSKQPTFCSLAQSVCEANTLASSLHLEDVFSKPNGVINSLSSTLPKRYVSPSDNEMADRPVISHYSFSERDYIFNTEISIFETINPSEFQRKNTQSFSADKPEIPRIQENSERERKYLDALDNSQMSQYINENASNEKVQKKVNSFSSGSSTSLLACLHATESKGPDIASTPVSKSTTSELTVIPATGLDTSDSTTIFDPTSKFSDIAVPSVVKTCRGVRSQELPIVPRKRRPLREKSDTVVTQSQARITLKPKFSERRRGKCASRRSLSNASNISNSKTVSMSNTSAPGSSLSKMKSTSSPRIVSKLPKRKDVCKLKLKPQPATPPTGSSILSHFMHVPVSAPKRNIHVTTPTDTNKLSLSALKVFGEPASDTEISEQVDLSTSDSKLFSKEVSNFNPLGQQTASVVHPNITNHVPTIISDIKLKEQKGTLQATPKALDTVLTLISDQKRLHLKASPESEFKGRELKIESQIIAVDNLSDIKMKADKIVSASNNVHTLPTTNTVTVRPESAPTQDSERCGNFAAMMSCLSRHEKLLRGVAARRGLTCTLPPSCNDSEPRTYKAYLSSLRQHLELVRLVCPAERTESVGAITCSGSDNIVQPPMSKLHLIPMEATAV